MLSEMIPPQQNILREAEDGEDDALTINSTLEAVHRRLTTDQELKDRLRFTVHRKSGKSNSGPVWEKVFDYQGPDPETRDLLDQYRAFWTANPAGFVSGPMSLQRAFRHPLLHTISQCLWLDIHTAWNTMLRRCHYVTLARLQQKYNMVAEDIAGHLTASELFAYDNVDQLNKKVARALDAGSRLGYWEEHIAPGVIFVLGRACGDDLYEPTFLQTSTMVSL